MKHLRIRKETADYLLSLIGKSFSIEKVGYKEMKEGEIYTDVPLHPNVTFLKYYGMKGENSLLFKEMIYKKEVIGGDSYTYLEDDEFIYFSTVATFYPIPKKSI
jgi:hypothetical protein